jgi:hypothetical protein
VLLSEVLDHAPEILNPGGLNCMVLDDDYTLILSLLRSNNGVKPWWVALPHYINYVDFDSTAALANWIGFEVVLREATFRIDLFLVLGDNYVGND